MALRPHVHREDVLEQVGVLLPAAGDLRGERRRRPRVEDVGVADEAAGLVALVLGVAGGRVGRRVDRQLGLGGQQRLVVARLAVLVERVPDRDRHAEEALAADEPVAVEALDPVVVAVLHVGGVPRDLAAAGDERGAQVGIAAAVADVPLARGDDLERTVAALVELHRVLDRARFADQKVRLDELLDDDLLRLLRREAGDLRVGVGVDAVRCLGEAADRRVR